jgi:uncharacterized protein
MWDIREYRMPFETGTTAPKRIAVIGAGISGLGAAHMLADDHRVVLFEAEGRLGGHARTVMAGRRGDQPVDTGFIVFNYVNYPHLVRLFEDLGVPVAASNMSFSASIGGGRLEYALNDLNAISGSGRTSSIRATGECCATSRGSTRRRWRPRGNRGSPSAG